jgi:hypothetical protein
MNYEPPASTAMLSASSSSSSSPSGAAGSVPRALAESSSDSKRDIDADLEMQLENLRGSFDRRAAELGRRTAKVRDALDVAERIRERPVAALALGLAGGALAALVTPTLGKATAGLFAAFALRAGRKVAWQVAERAIAELMSPLDREQRALQEDREIVNSLRAEIL